MTTLGYYPKDADKAYVSNNLLLPKQFANAQVIQAALTYTLNDEEPVIEEETGEVIGVRQKVLRLWDENPTHLVVPREFLPPGQRENFRCEFVDMPPPQFERVRIDDNITLRDQDQAAAYHALLNHQSGTLNLSCGQGKTVIALKAAATFKVPTIVVVNTTALLEQWKEEITRHLGVDSVGVLQGSNHDWEDHPIVLSMVHTLSNRRSLWSMDFRRRFGLVLYDEGHHMSAPVFVLSADLFFGRRYSLTATAQRTDGLEVVYQYHLGRVIHANLRQHLIPTTVFHVLRWALPYGHKPMVIDRNGDINTSRVRTYLGGLDWRNDIIYNQLLADLHAGRQILVLSHSVKHVQTLSDRLSARGGGMITGETPQESRMAILKNANPVFGTFQLAREGLNKPSLDTLYVVTPFSNSNDLQQSWGRIQRQHERKQEPLVRVFEDTAFNSSVKSCNRLRRILQGLNYPYEREITLEEQ